MIPSDHFFVGGGAADTAITPVAAALLMLAVALMFSLPRKYMLAPLLFAAMLVPSGNVVVLGGFHLMPVRFLALAGWLRLGFLKHRAGESRLSGGYNNVDRAVVGCYVAIAIAVFFQWMSTAALANQAGALVSTIGMYLVLRQLIRDEENVVLTVKVLVVIAGLSVLGMVNEHLTLHNLFGTVVGGVQTFPLIREGKIRAEGPFQHAILAGVFGATTLPLSLWLLTRRRSFLFAVLGIASATAMTVLSASSTPVMAFGGTIVTVCLWPLRNYMRALRRAFSLMLIALHLVMKAPVWFLIARVDVIGGSASFDRANLIDTCIRHFSGWWLRGTHDTGNWGWSMWDLSNQFVSVAESGGLLALIFFISVVSRSFGRIGSARKGLAGDKKKEWGMWFLGAAVYSHVLAYFGVSYFDQTQVTWFVLLAIISVATNPQTPESIEEPVASETVFHPALVGVGSNSISSWRTAESAAP